MSHVGVPNFPGWIDDDVRREANHLVQLFHLIAGMEQAKLKRMFYNYWRIDTGASTEIAQQSTFGLSLKALTSLFNSGISR